MFLFMSFFGFLTTAAFPNTAFKQRARKTYVCTLKTGYFSPWELLMKEPDVQEHQGDRTTGLVHTPKPDSVKKYAINLTIEFMAGVGAYHNRVWIQTRSGKLLSTIQENMKEAMELRSPSRKIIAFSTHDVTIAALLDSMGILRAALDPQGRPSFMSTIVFELWQNNDNRHYIKVLYRRGPGSEEFRDLSNEIKGCKKENLCTVEDYYASVGNYTSDDPAALCLNDGTSSSSRNELELIVILMVATTFFAVLFFAVLIFLIPCQSPTKSKTEATNAEDSLATRS